jgi:oligopeptide/dipeptide ABC transporter ATP-binding protein
MPRPETERGHLESIPGAPPLAGADLPGCAFAQRCPMARDTCRAAVP